MFITMAKISLIISRSIKTNKGAEGKKQLTGQGRGDRISIGNKGKIEKWYVSKGELPR